MTNTVSPCTVCGTVPEVDAQFDDECKPRCGHIRSPVATILIDDWTHSCNYELGRACRELGIETVEQLKARLAPDPRAAVLESIREFLALPIAVPADLSERGRDYYILDVTEYRKQILKLIAAQRGEE